MPFKAPKKIIKLLGISRRMLQSRGFAFEYETNKNWSDANESVRVSDLLYGELKDNDDIEAKIPLNWVSQLYRLIL